MRRPRSTETLFAATVSSFVRCCSPVYAAAAAGGVAAPCTAVAAATRSSGRSAV